MPGSFFDNPQMLAPRQTLRTDLGGGAFELRCPDPLGPYARCVGEWLERWAKRHPMRRPSPSPPPLDLAMAGGG